MMSEKALALGLDEDAGLDELPELDPARLHYIEPAEKRNLQRGLFAALGLKAYAARAGCHEPIDTVVSDFLGDLMHLCDVTGVEMDNVLYRARENYEAEIGGEG